MHFINFNIREAKGPWQAKKIKSCKRKKKKKKKEENNPLQRLLLNLGHPIQGGSTQESHPKPPNESLQSQQSEENHLVEPSIL